MVLVQKNFGYKINSMGFGWFFIPMAHCDTAEIWLTKQWKRVIVDVAGAYMDTLSAAIMVLLGFVFSGDAMLFCWLYAFYLYMRAVFNLSPLSKLDGYYVCADIFDDSSIRKHATNWLRRVFLRSWWQKTTYSLYKKEMFYWLICIGYLFVLSAFGLLIQRFIFDPLIEGLHPYAHLLMPAFILFLALYSNILRSKHIGEQARSRG